MADYDNMDSREQDIVQDTMQEFSDLQLWRNTYGSHCEEIAQLIWPAQRNTFFYNSFNWPGEKKTQHQVDATGMLSLNKFKTIADGILTPQHMVWHHITADDPSVMRDRETRLWCELATNTLFKYRYAGRAGFVGANSAYLKALGAFGSPYMFVEQFDGTNFGGAKGIRYKVIPTGEFYRHENHQGVFDGGIRTFRLTARQIWQRWGEERFPEALRSSLESQSNYPHMILHRICPRKDYDNDALDARGQPWVSYYVSVDGYCLLQEGGYRSLPVISSLYDQEPGEPYGRSIAAEILPSLKTLNAQKQTFLKQAHRAADPVLLTADDGLMDISLRPGALNKGGMTIDGKPLVGVLPSGSIQTTIEMMQEERGIVEDAFLVKLFKLAEETREMSAREVVERIAERGILVNPILGRQYGDYVDPLVERELDVLQWQRLLPPMPQALKEAIKGGVEMKIINTGPLAKAMQAQATAGLLRSLEIADRVAQHTQDPSIYDHYAWDRVIPDVSQNEFVPESYMATEQERQAKGQSRAQAAERERQTKELPGRAAIVKAQAIAQKAAAGQNIGGALSGVPEGQMPQGI